MRRILYLFTLCLLLSAFSSHAQKREFRAAWIATVGNIDWPSKQTLTTDQQKAEFIHRLDQVKAFGGNTVIVQIRPSADAFYPSTLEPWSHYLTGKQGRAPIPYYDPLQFMVEETHKRCMEFHAWFNPFRALVDSKKNPNPPDHVTRQHPDWIVSYGGKSYINPGIPAAREYVLSVITDVVKRYDIDAVHLDDYFYPYRIAGVEFGDGAAYAKYNPAATDRETWRRNNVDLVIQNLNVSIKAIKPYVKLGISPFGVWRNYSKDTAGSHTRGGQTNYDDLYADVRMWQEKGWIDYLLPQLYWERGHRLVGYEVLLPWWRDHAYGRGMYFGLGLYRMVGAKSGLWSNPRELTGQIRDMRESAPGTGFALYSLSNFDKLPHSVFDSIAAVNAVIAIPPPMRWLDSIPPAPPVIKVSVAGATTQLQWTITNPKSEPLRYAVYRFAKGEALNLERQGRLLAVTNDAHYTDETAHLATDCIYLVTALDHLWNESRPSNTVQVTSR